MLRKISPLPFLILFVITFSIKSEAQTQLLKNINPSESYVGDYVTYSSADFNGELYYIATPSSAWAPPQLWKSDGTQLGTTKVTSVLNGEGIRQIFKFNNLLFFSGETAQSGTELWKTDGTETGTSIVKDLSPGTGSGDPGNFCIVGNELFFTANYNGFEFELWKTDGTGAGTVFIKSIPCISFANALDWFSSANGLLFFYCYTDGNGTNMWRSDGTPGGTYKLTDDQGVALYNNGIPYSVNNKVVFMAQNNSSDVQRLWCSDGNPGGTLKLYDDTVWEMNSFANKVFFSGNNTTGQKEIWSTNGTTGGTNLLYTIPSQYNYVSFVGVYNDNLIYNAQDLSNQVPATSNNLSLSNNTSLVIQNSFVEAIVGNTFQGAIVRASSNILWHGAELNLLLNSTCNEVGDIRTGILGSNINPVKQIGDFSFFTAEDGLSNTQLWCVNHNNLQFQKLTNIGIAAVGSESELLTIHGNQLYFSANDGINGNEPWVSDGTEAGTHLIKDINPGNQGSYIRDFAEFNGEMYFFTISPNEALYKTDGTELGTTLIKNIEYLGGKRFVEFNGELYFVRGGSNNNEVWKTDGTNTGTQFAFSVPGPGGFIDKLYKVGNSIFFLGGQGGIYNWYKSDGTISGTEVANPNDTDPQFSAYTNNVHTYNNQIIATIVDNNNLLSIFSLEEASSNANLIAEFPNYPDVNGYNQASNMLFSQNFMYCVLAQSINDYALWRFNLINNTSELIYDSETYISEPFELNDIIYFNSGNKLRGITNQTSTPFDILLNNVGIGAPTNFGSKICLLGSFNSNELFSFTPGPQSWVNFDGEDLVPLTNPNLGISYFQNRAIINDRIYFTANSNAFGNEIWFYDSAVDTVPSIYLDTTNCIDFFWTLNGEVYNQSGFYYHTVSDISGNDSLHLLLNLGIYKPFGSTITGAPYIVPTESATCNGLLYLDVGSTELFGTIDTNFTIVQPNEVIVGGDLCHGIHSISITDSCGYSYSSVFIIPYPGETITNVSGTTAIDSIGFIVENCSLMYGDIDTSFITSIDVLDSTATVEWTIIDIFGNNYVEIATYNIPEGQGNYIFQISLYCPTRANEQVFAITQDIQNMLGVEINSESDSTVFICPNPTESDLTISFEGQNADYTIYDTQGKLVQTNTVSSGEKISISHLNAGIYFFELKTEKENVLKRIIKK